MVRLAALESQDSHMFGSKGFDLYSKKVQLKCMTRRFHTEKESKSLNLSDQVVSEDTIFNDVKI